MKPGVPLSYHVSQHVNFQSFIEPLVTNYNLAAEEVKRNESRISLYCAP